MANSLFIVIEGIDGSGKSETLKRLHNYLYSKDKKIRILTTREPTSGKNGLELREMLKNEKDPKTSSEKLVDLFIKDRAGHLNNFIIPFLNNPNESELNIVICDRYYYSTIAFQHAQGIGLNSLIEKNKDFRKPDIAFILDVYPKLSLKRIENREKEKFEELEFMKKVRGNFLKLPQLLEDNIKIIDSSGTLDEVFNSIKIEIDKIIN
jgi:dTMP kinase